jgi:hypothetical protein
MKASWMSILGLGRRMNLQRSPNGWSCLPTAFAMALDLPIAYVIEFLGHDGSEIVCSGEPEPYCRRAFHIQELVYLAWNLGYSVTEFEAMPFSKGRSDMEQIPVQMPISSEARMTAVMHGQTGIMAGKARSGMPHAVAWSGFDCYDPNGTIYGIDEFTLQAFWAIKSTQK